MKKSKKDFIIEGSYRYAVKHGYRNITVEKLAKYLKISHPLIYYYFKSVKDLKKIIIKDAIKKNKKSIIFEAVFLGDTKGIRIPQKLKKER